MTQAAAEIGDATRLRVRRAWAQLLPRADAIADGITLTLLDSSRGGWYEAVTPEVRSELRRSTRDHVRRGLRTMAGLATEEERAVHLWRETGRQRARQGVPMELVLNAYAIGSRALWEALMAERHNASAEIDDVVLLAAGRQVWSALDVQSTTMAEAYRRESARIQRRDLQRQQRLLDVLLDGRYADDGVTAEAREMLGIDPDEAVACIVIPLDGLGDGPMRGVEDQLDRLGAASFWHVRGDRQVGLVPLRRTQTADLICALAPVRARVGVATAPEGLSGVAAAYRLAAGAAETIPRGTATVISAADCLPELLVAGSPEVAAQLVEQTLGRVLVQAAPQRQALLATLRALLDHNGSPTHAAQALYCHRNTVIYRLRQLEELTGRRLSLARDRLVLGLALMAVDLPRG
jgi:PucR C-terminal helix-turn-helix domain/GGDEF-like domain